MKFSIDRDLTNNIYSAVISFDTYGNEKLSEEEELKLIEDFGYPKVQTGGIFKGYLKDNVVTPIENDEEVSEDGILISMTFDYSLVELKNTSQFKCEIPSDKIVLTDKQKETMTKDSMAIAKVELFIAVMKKRIEKALLELREKSNDFDHNNPEIFVI